MMNYLKTVTEIICGGFLPAILFLGGAVFLFRLGKFLLFPKKIRKSSSKASLSSLWLALGGTLGVGNICGVVSAIYIGGAGCVFWMWICTFLSACTKYAETVLAVKYRTVLKDGSTVGGAPYYIKKALKMNKTANVFAIFCILTAFTVGCATQVKTAADIIVISTDIPRWTVGALFFLFLLMLTLGKAKAISAFTSKAVPFLCVGYAILCLLNIFTFREYMLPLTKQIITEAFTLKAGTGGIIAFLSSPALRLGITRGVMSSEAGCGTAPYAYASDKNASAVHSGLLGIAEVLTDTLILCTLTAYAVLLPQVPLSESSAESVITAFSAILGTLAPFYMSISIFLFALASASAWSFYAEQSAVFLSIKKFHLPFSIIYSVSAFLFCFAKEESVWFMSDLTVSVMATLNIICLLLLSGEVKSITNSALKEK